MRGVKCMTDTHTSSTRRATPPSPNLEMNPICVEAPLGSFLFFVFFFFMCVWKMPKCHWALHLSLLAKKVLAWVEEREWEEPWLGQRLLIHENAQKHRRICS